ncbi:MAG: F0F1 ATP synthase subunit B [Gorillibacterium sp.]|nr:F0F1 ATP synthase subunit B [Gorillibacterium sp.]
MDFNIPSFVFTIVSFLVLLFMLNRYALGPLFSVMEKRREHVQNELQAAEKSRVDSAKFLEDQRIALDTARKEAYGIVDQAKQTGTRQADEIIGAARSEANRVKDDAIKEINNEKNKALVDLRKQVSTMSVMIASKIIEKQVDEGVQEELVDKYLKEVGEQS